MNEPQAKHAELLAQCQEIFEPDLHAGVLRWKPRGNNGVKAGSVAGWINSKGYRVTRVGGRQFRVHQIIFLMAYGFIPEQVDHINGDRADNRLSNLRAANNAQNQCNAKLGIRNKSGVKGVHWHKQLGKWHAQCRVNKRQFYVGVFDSLDVAAEAVKAFRAEQHGEFARHD